MRAPTGLPDCPDWLANRPAAVAFWNEAGRQLEDLDLMSPAYSHAFAVLCDTYADWMRARELVDTFGDMEESPTGIKIGAAIKLKNEQADRFTKLLTQFGLTPSAITGVQKLDNDAKQTDPMARILGA